MPMSTNAANPLLQLLLAAVTFPGIAQNVAASPNAQLFVALHTADPGDAGTQATSEIAYTGYARQGINRLPAAWTFAGKTASPAAAIEFPEMTAGAGGTATFWSLGLLVAGAGIILARGPLTPSIPIIVGTTPRLKTGTQIVIT